MIRNAYGCSVLLVVVLLSGCNPIGFLQAKTAEKVEASAAAEETALRERYPEIVADDKLDAQVRKILAAETARLKQALSEVKSLAEAGAAGKRAAQNTASGVGSAALAALMSAAGLWLRGRKWKDAFITVARTIENADGGDTATAAETIKSLVAKASPRHTPLGDFIADAVAKHVQP